MIMKKKIGMVVKWKNMLERIYEIASKEKSDCKSLSSVWEELQVQGKIMLYIYIVNSQIRHDATDKKVLYL